MEPPHVEWEDEPIDWADFMKLMRTFCFGLVFAAAAFLSGWLMYSML